MVDTRQKRSSCLGFNGPYRLTLPPPAAGVSAADRSQVAFCYGAILVMRGLAQYIAIVNDAVGKTAMVDDAVGKVATVLS